LLDLLDQEWQVGFGEREFRRRYAVMLYVWGDVLVMGLSSCEIRVAGVRLRIIPGMA
jgi:hypothetical protein